MAKLIAGHDAVGEWRGPGQDDPDAAAVLDLDPGPEDGHQPRVIQRAGPRQADMPGYAAAESAATAQAARAPWDAAARSVRLPYSGITLSDEGGPGERTRIRRSERLAGAQRSSAGARVSGRSVTAAHVPACPVAAAAAPSLLLGGPCCPGCLR
jgi:hypothetical protein